LHPPSHSAPAATLAKKRILKVADMLKKSGAVIDQGRC
jgi:hypothetical protein